MEQAELMCGSEAEYLLHEEYAPAAEETYEGY